MGPDTTGMVQEMVGLARHLLDQLTDEPDLRDVDVDALRLADVLMSYARARAGGAPSGDWSAALGRF